MVRRGPSRRVVLCGSGAALLGCTGLTRAQVAIVVTDMLGRNVVLAARPQRIVLLDARDALTMAMLDPDPMRLVAGWTTPDTLDSDFLVRALVEQADGPIPEVGRNGPDGVSLEAIIAVKPDVVIATALTAAHVEDLSGKLARSNIPVLFSDSATNETGKARGDRLPALMRMWGLLLGRERRAEEYLRFVETKLANVEHCVRPAAPRKAYLEVKSTYDDCCWAAGSGVWGPLLVEAGGRTLDAASAPWFQKVSAEQLIVEQPDAYIATGGDFSGGTRPAIAPGLAPRSGQSGLETLVARPGFGSLTAVRKHNVHGVWTGLLTVPPLNVMFVELVAKWLHPERCGTIAPEETLAEIDGRFSAIPLTGPMWESLGYRMPARQ